jgi:hypothetical protein
MKTAYKLSLLLLAWSVWGAQAAVVLTDDFSYADGPLIAVSEGKWKTHSGTAGQVEVTSGTVRLTQAQTEDVHAVLEGSPYLPAGNDSLYASFEMEFHALPGGTGGYFAHFKDGANGFRGRLFATTAGAAAGSFRVGVSAGANAPSAVLERDLELNTVYKMVCRYQVASATTAIWIDPESESDAHVISNDSGSAIAVVSFALRQSVSSGNGMGTLTVGNLVVATMFPELLGVPEIPDATMPPVISRHPGNQMVFAGENARFTVQASGAGPLGFQWQFEGNDLEGETGMELRVIGAGLEHAGVYAVRITNGAGSVTSEGAWLEVHPAPVRVVWSVSELRDGLEKPGYVLMPKSEKVTVEGVVTSHVNLSAAADARFFLQDATGGIAVFVPGGREVRPSAGDWMRVAGELEQVQGMLQIRAALSNPEHEVALLGAGNNLPIPVPFPLSAQTDFDYLEAIEGRLISISGVVLDQANPLFTGGSNVKLTDADGKTFTLRIDARVSGIIDQLKPAGAIRIVGILGQIDSSAPYTSGYHILPTRFEDIDGPKLARITFVNTLENLLRPGDAVQSGVLTEYALRPGEGIRIEATAVDPQGRPVTLAVGSGETGSGAWLFNHLDPEQPKAVFLFTASAEDAGKTFGPVLEARNEDGVHAALWTVTVPSEEEQWMVVNEFLANPVNQSESAHFNPLRREIPSASERIAVEDEYIELVNASNREIDLGGWTLHDAAGLRHIFSPGDMIEAQGAVVVYGGKTSGSEPRLEAPHFAAAQGSAGLSLNNGGDAIEVRNGEGKLVARVVYTGEQLTNAGALTRFPDLNGPFVAHASISDQGVSPGTNYDGSVFRLDAEPTPEPTPEPLPEPELLPEEPEFLPVQEMVPPELSISKGPGGIVVLRWEARGGMRYSVWMSESLAGPFGRVAADLTFATREGEFALGAPEGRTIYYVVSAEPVD